MFKTTETADLVIVYDGECVFCENYVRFQKLKDNVGSIKLLDARVSTEVIMNLASLGMDINQGMAAHYKNKWYFGAECMTLLAQLSDLKSFKGKIWGLLFINKKLTELLYPVFRSIRNIVLYLRGVKKIDPKM